MTLVRPGRRGSCCKARQARKLLLETELSLQQISEMLGFSEHNNFNRFFKRIEGMPPGIFRLSKGKFIDTQHDKTNIEKSAPESSNDTMV